MTDTAKSSRTNLLLWAAQIALACLYCLTGFLKLTQPIEALTQMMGWPGSMPGLTRFVGGAEIAGALGMILPMVTKVQPRLTALAAAGLALIQILAIPFHISRGEYFVLPVNLVLLALAVFVVRGRRHI